MKHLTTLAAVNAIAFASAPPATAETKGGKRVEPLLTGIASIPMPTKTSKRGSVSLYPFDSLAEVGQAFGVKNKTALQLSSIISNANRKNSTEERDAAGNVVYETKDLTAPDGTVTKVPDTTKPKMVAVKHFFAFDVSDEYRKANKEAFAKGGTFEGVTTLVFRDK